MGLLFNRSAMHDKIKVLILGWCTWCIWTNPHGDLRTLDSTRKMTVADKKGMAYSIIFINGNT